MKFKFKIPKMGDTKIVRKFLFFPIFMHNEVRWLEYATVKYELQDGSKVGSISWNAVEFLD